MSDIDADTQAVTQRFESLSPRVRAHAKAGFSFLSEMDAKESRSILDYIVECIENRLDLDDVKASEITGLTEQRVRNIFTAATLVGFAVLDYDLGPSAVVNLLPDTLIAESDRSAAKLIADFFISRRDELKEGLEKKRLSATVLPMFRRLNVEVDLRFDFDLDEQVKRAVPVAIAHIETDNSPDELFVQFDIAAIDSIIKKLTKIRDRMSKIARVRIEHG